MQQHDVFISYRHSRKAEVLALCEHLDRAGIRYFRDEQRRDDDDSIQRTIESGLRHSKLLLAWYDPSYLQSRACAWEFSRALLAAHAGGGGLQRIVCVDPSHSFGHIVPESLADQARLVSPDDPSALIHLLRERADSFAEPLGALVAGASPHWYERERPTHPTWVGRAGDLIRLFHQLDHGRLAMHGGARAPVALTGWGGEGKTMLAEQYALRFAAAYPGGVVWLSGATEDGVTPRAGEWQQQLESALVAAAEGKLNLPAGELVKGMADPLQRIRVLKEAIDRALRSRVDPDAPKPVAPYLWIVDDLPDRLSAKEQRLWLAPSDEAHCIATLREAGGVGAVFHALPVRQLEEDEALQLLARRRAPRSDEEGAIAREILAAVDRLPLALELGAVLVETLGYQAYRDVLQAPGNAALERLVASLGAALPTGHESSIGDDAPLDRRAVWIVLRLAAILAPVPLPDAFAQHVLHAFGLTNVDAALQCRLAVISLHRAAVITRDADNEPDGIRTHALIARTVVEARLGDLQKSSLVAKAIAAAQAWLNDEMLQPPIAGDRRLLSTTTRLVAQTSSLEAASLANDVGEFARRIGQLPAARSLHERSHALRIDLLGEEHPDTLISNANLALTMNEQGHLAGARALQEQVVALRRRLLGTEHLATLNALANLASMIHDQGDLRGARTMLDEVLSMRRQLLGDEHPDTLIALDALASTMRDQGDLPGARALQEKVLGLRRQVLGEEHHDTLSSMGNLALTMQDQGDLPGARGLEEQVLVLCRRLLGEEHPRTLTSMNNLAGTMRAQGDLSGARALQEHELALHRRLLGEEHPGTLNSMSNLALTIQDQGDLPGARALQEHVLALRRQLLGEEHPRTLISIHNLASTIRVQGDLAGARALEEQGLALSRQLLGDEHPHTLTSMNNLAVTLRMQGDQPGARALQEQVLTLRRRLLGETHPDTLRSMGQLAWTMQDQCDLQGARALQDEELALRLQVFGEEHRDTLTLMNNLAGTMEQQGDLPGARALQERVVALRRRLTGEEHSDTLASMHNLALTMRAQGDFTNAQALQEQVLALRRRLGGEGHPATLTSMNSLALTLRAQGDLPGARALQEKVLALRRRHFGEKHPDTDHAIRNLHETLLRSKDLQAIQRLEIHVQALRVLHGHTGEALESLHAYFDARRAAHGFPPRGATPGDEFDTTAP